MQVPPLTRYLAGARFRLGPAVAWAALDRLALKVQRDCRSDEVLQGGLIQLVVFVYVDGAPDIPLQAGVEESRGVVQGGALGKGQFDDALVTLTRADDAAVGEDGSSSTSILRRSRGPPCG